MRITNNHIGHQQTTDMYTADDYHTTCDISRMTCEDDSENEQVEHMPGNMPVSCVGAVSCEINVLRRRVRARKDISELAFVNDHNWTTHKFSSLKDAIFQTHVRGLNSACSADQT